MGIQSSKVKVLGSEMHYLSEGSGDPVIFLHGAPVSSYLWRNIIPKISTKAHCIAPDFIGMGDSDKPAIEYTISDHIQYFEGFIEALKLKKFTLVMLGLGSVVGTVYAQKNPEKISGLVFLESFLYIPKNLQEVPMLIQELMPLMNNEKKLKEMVLEENYAVEKFLSSLTLKKIAPDVLDVYRKPYQDKKARLVLWQALLDNPLFNSKSPMIPMINDYIQWLKVTQIRKLLVYAVPGFLVSMDTVKWCIDNFSELTTVDIGFGLHYLPETLSDEISDAIFNWIA